MKSRIMSIILLLGLLVVAVLCFPKHETVKNTKELKSHDFEVEGIYYKIVNDTSSTVLVTYKGSDSEAYSHEYSGDIVIPGAVTYKDREYSVTEIGDNAFGNCSTMTSISIPASVRLIGYGAFNGCEALKKIHINDLSTWCQMSFWDISDVAGDSPFRYADELYLNGKLITDLVVPDDVTEIGSHAFEGYEKLRSVVLHENIEAIHKSAFLNCTNLSSLNIPKGIKYIGPYAFDETSWCENMPDGVIYAGPHLYKYKGEMPANTSIVVKEGIETICEFAFDMCKGLISITLPNTLKQIHNYAFCGCDNLKEIYCQTQEPPYYNRYYNDYHPDAKLYIAKGTSEIYKNSGFMGRDNVVETNF